MRAPWHGVPDGSSRHCLGVGVVTRGRREVQKGLAWDEELLVEAQVRDAPGVKTGVDGVPGHAEDGRGLLHAQVRPRDGQVRLVWNWLPLLWVCVHGPRSST